jgi:signal transduction histidine kinase/streptogramin lyase
VFTNDLPSLPALSIAQESKDAIWISYTDGSARRLQGGRVGRFGAAEGLPGGAVPCFLASDAAGQIWFTKAGELGVYRSGVFTTLHRFEEQQSLRLHGGQGGGVWLRAGRSLVRFREGDEPQVLGQLPLEAKAVDPSVLFEDRDGAVWIGSASSGLFRYADGTFTKVATSHPEIRSITQDREGTLWVGTGGGGLNRLRPRVIDLLSTDSGLPFQVVLSVCEDVRGTLWVALQNGTLASWQGESWVSVPPAPEWPANDATCLAADPRGGLWIGTRTHGLYHYQEGRFSQWDRSRGLASDYVRSLLVDAATNLWVGQHWSNCVQRLSEGIITTFMLPPESEPIRAMAQDTHGVVWAGGSDGQLYRFEQDRLTDATVHTPPLPRPIRCLRATADGSLWVGYGGGGLGWFRTNEFLHIGPEEGFPLQDISQIVPDAQGNLWLGGNRGVSQVRREDLEDLKGGRLDRIHLFAYGRDEGFPSLQASYGVSPGGLRGRDGRIWLPMRTGLVMIKPKQVFPNLLPPPVVIEHIRLDGREMRAVWNTGTRENSGQFSFATADLHLPPQHRKLELEFTALSFIAPESIRFRYRLDGLDDEWSEIGTERSVIYPRLPAGSYRFQVVACNNSGVWNDAGALLHFTVSPFFWQTVWFRVLVIACFTLSIVAVVRYLSFQRLRTQVQRLEQESVLHAERARIARDIHDDLGASLTQIALLSDLTRQDLGQPAIAEQHVGKVAAQARQVIKTLDEIVWAVNPRNDTLTHLLDYIGQFAVDFLSAAEIRCRVDFPENPPERVVAGEDRHNLFLVIKEALNNVVKHAHASEVWLRAQVTPEGLSLSVEDNGHGLDPAGKDAWADGLLNMRQRLSAIGGTLEVASDPGKGATVFVCFPWPRH